MKITFLGTGTSQGIPVIGCSCSVCNSEDPHDHRLRSSLLISLAETNICIDVGPDFRQQMLRAGIKHLNAILLTHEHNDHVAGLDDVRPFNFMQKKNMPLYGTPHVLDVIKKRFAYIFDENPYPGTPKIELVPVSKDRPFFIHDNEFIPVEVMHGNLPVLGFRIANFTYLTDVKTISETEMQKVKGTEILVLNALQRDPHYSHLNLAEALALVEELKPQKALFTHISHTMGRIREVSKILPPHVELAFDGLTLEL